MADIYFWKLALDGALVGSLLFMCLKFRGMGGPNVNVGHLRELESSLKQLLKEAERSSMTLGEELGRKKGQLEQLLFDIETAEQRLNRSFDEASELKRSLLEASRRVEQQRSYSQPESPKVQERAAVSQSVEQKVDRREPRYEPQSPVAPEYSQAIPEPPSFESLRPENVRQPRESTPQGIEPQQSETAAGAVNIYGEPIGQNPSLRESIERETTQQFVSEEQQPVEQSLEDLYGAADDLLRAGQSLEHVARTTALPIDEVRMLSELISREQYVQEQNGEGSPVKRGTQVL